jgi:hypothetical protein
LGVKFNDLGDECESRKTIQREEMCTRGKKLLGRNFLCMRKRREQEREIEAGAAMEGEL